MTSSDVLCYWRPAAQALYGKFTHDSLEIEEKLKRLDRDLGLKGPESYSAYLGRAIHHDMPMSDDLRHLLKLITGEHGKTILKAYRIKKGLK